MSICAKSATKKLVTPSLLAVEVRGDYTIYRPFLVSVDFISTPKHSCLTQTHSTNLTEFLIDTGSSLSLLPIIFSIDKSKQLSLRAANGTLVNTKGSVTVDFKIRGINDPFTWEFHIADVTYPILGADFLSAYELLTDCSTRTLLHKNIPLTPQKDIVRKETIRCDTLQISPKQNTSHEYAKHLNTSYADAVKKGSIRQGTLQTTPRPCTSHTYTTNHHVKPNDFFNQTKTTNEKLDLPDTKLTSTNQHLTNMPSFISELINKYPKTERPPQDENTYTHRITTTPTCPLRERFRPLSNERLEAVKKEFSELQEAGTIRRSSSPWASPIHLVTKKDGTLRPCGDYRRLNKVTIHDSYPMPLMRDALYRLSGCSIFSTLDLKKAYHQIPVAECDIQKTAVTTPFGLFEYLFMPFGLRNAAQTFQRHIDTIFADTSFVIAYIDDIIVGSKDLTTHKKTLRYFVSNASKQFTYNKLRKVPFRN